MIRTAIVGVSGYGRWHLLMAMDQMLLGRLRLVGATIINPEIEVFICQRLRTLGVPIFPSFEEMIAALQGQIDLCLIPTGIHYHAPMTLAALRAGANVLVEKPLAATLQDVDAIRAEEARTGRWVAVGFQDLYAAETHVIKQRVLRGDIGRLQRITVRGQWPRGRSYYKRNNWAGRLRMDDAWILDSPVNNALAHYLSIALFWAGESHSETATLVTVQAGLYRAQQIESFDTVSLRLTTRTGTQIDFHGTHSGERNGPPEIILQGTEGKLHWVYDRDYSITGVNGKPERHRLQEFLGARMLVGEHVVRKFAEPEVFVCTTLIARAHTQVINLVHEKFQIHDIPASEMETVAEAGDFFTRVRGLDAAIDSAVAGGTLLGGSSAPWAVASAPCTVSNYETFGGCWQPDGKSRQNP
jgi:predicted dehydrogenase